MAITHNFKEGIDWVADPTGETPLANHIFVSKSGDDGTGDGSPQNTYATIEKAILEAGAGPWVIIVGTGRYTEENISSSSPSNTIKGDGYVIFSGDSTNTFIIGRLKITNLICINYALLFNGRNYTIDNCTIINCGAQGGSSGGNIHQFSTYINCNITAGSSSRHDVLNCKLINSAIILNRTGVGQTLTVQSTFIDEDSIIQTNEFTGSTENSFNAINGILVENGTITKSNNLFNINPSFNNVIGFDFSVKAGSALIGAGLGGENIGNVSIGKGYFQGVSLLDTAIDANANIAYNSLGEIELQGGAGTSEVFTTSEEEALELSVLGTIRISGFLDFVNNTPDFDNALLNPNNLILEIDTALLDGIWIGYKKYRWNEQPTQNADGTPNGDSGYDWSDNNKIPYKKRRFRITLRSNYTQA